MLTCLKAAAVNPRLQTRKKKSYETIQPGIMSAAGTLLYLRNRDLNAHQTMTGLTVKQGGGSAKCIKRLHSRGVSVAYETVLHKQVTYGKDYDQTVLQWKKKLEEEYKTEKELQLKIQDGDSGAQHDLEELNKSRHPGYMLNGDNVDLRIRPRQSTMMDKTKDLHYYHLLAVENRIVDHNLSSETPPPADIRKVPLTTLLPSLEDNEHLRNEWATLIGHCIARNIPSLDWMGSFVPSHIQHQYMNETKKKSHVVITCFYFIYFKLLLLIFI